MAVMPDDRNGNILLCIDILNNEDRKNVGEKEGDVTMNFKINNDKKKKKKKKKTNTKIHQ